MSGALEDGLDVPVVAEVAVERLDWAVWGREPGATLRGRAGEDWAGGGMVGRRRRGYEREIRTGSGWLARLGRGRRGRQAEAGDGKHACERETDSE